MGKEGLAGNRRGSGNRGCSASPCNRHQSFASPVSPPCCATCAPPATWSLDTIPLLPSCYIRVSIPAPYSRRTLCVFAVVFSIAHRSKLYERLPFERVDGCLINWPDYLKDSRSEEEDVKVFELVGDSKDICYFNTNLIEPWIARVSSINYPLLFSPDFPIDQDPPPFCLEQRYSQIWDIYLPFTFPRVWSFCARSLHARRKERRRRKRWPKGGQYHGSTVNCM